jgi:hypothetical protein
LVHDSMRPPDSDAFASVPPEKRQKAEAIRLGLIARWKARGKRLNQATLALSHAIAADLVLHSRDSAWGRWMRGRKAGKASLASPKHFPTEELQKRRETYQRWQRQRRERELEHKPLPSCQAAI